MSRYTHNTEDERRSEQEARDLDSHTARAADVKRHEEAQRAQREVDERRTAEERAAAVPPIQGGTS